MATRWIISMNKPFWLAGAAILAALAVTVAAEKPAAPPEAGARPKSAKEALAQFNSLIGGWRGVGQPRRGSAAGSWSETAEWVWDFSQPTAAIRCDVTQGKMVKSIRLTFDLQAGVFRATVTLPGGSARVYEGMPDDERLIMKSKPDAKGDHYRMTISRLNEKRTIVLIEKGRASSRAFSRLAEIGYTREGTRLAVEGLDGPECIVTGGKGTIKVTYKGQTYYVCCTGCKQAFDENPEKILAEYKERVADRVKSAK